MPSRTTLLRKVCELLNLRDFCGSGGRDFGRFLAALPPCHSSCATYPFSTATRHFVGCSNSSCANLHFCSCKSEPSESESLSNAYRRTLSNRKYVPALVQQVRLFNSRATAPTLYGVFSFLLACNEISDKVTFNLLRQVS